MNALKSILVVGTSCTLSYTKIKLKRAFLLVEVLSSGFKE